MVPPSVYTINMKLCKKSEKDTKHCGGGGSGEAAPLLSPSRLVMCGNREGLPSPSLQLGPGSCSKGITGLRGASPILVSPGNLQALGQPRPKQPRWWSFCLQHSRCWLPKIPVHSASAYWRPGTPLPGHNRRKSTWKQFLWWGKLGRRRGGKEAGGLVLRKSRSKTVHLAGLS